MHLKDNCQSNALDALIVKRGATGAIDSLLLNKMFELERMRQKDP